MKSIFNKTNAPYLVAGTLATLASLIPGAMFIAFPFVFSCEPNFIGVITGCAVVSTIIIAVLLCAVISKNNTISGQEEKENTELKAQLTRRNAPYLVAGTLAALASLVPGAMFIAPAFFFGNPLYPTGVITGCAVFSAIIITALLCTVISKNNTISEQDAKIKENTEFSNLVGGIAKLKEQLSKIHIGAKVQADIQKTTSISDYLNIDGQVSKQLDLSSIDTAKSIFGKVYSK